jgi:hypothetical protein
MGRKRSFPCVLAVLVLLLFGSLSAFRTFGKALLSEFNLIGYERITDYEERFAGLKKILPPQGVVGYLSSTPPGDMYVHSGASTAYFLTQYALAPVIVVNNPHRDLVIGNFPRAPQGPPGHGGSYVVLKDFGNGVLLLQSR